MLKTEVTAEWCFIFSWSILIIGKYSSRNAAIINPNPITVVLTRTTVLVTEDYPTYFQIIYCGSHILSANKCKSGLWPNIFMEWNQNFLH